ncbi:MAG: CHAT domain-containing protein [Candidatus Eisenbacteria sp.]|nr:CHAT domain-containing protein [Candidatus Eisenbacteria bacterium]
MLRESQDVYGLRPGADFDPKRNHGYASGRTCLVALILISVAAVAATAGGTDAHLEQSRELRAGGRYAEALRAAEESLDSLRRERARESWRVGDLDRQISTLRLIVELPPVSRRDLAKADSLYLEIRSHGSRREYATCVRLARQELEIRERYLGADHPETAVALNALGVALRETGEFGEAGEVLRRALDVQRSALEPEHPQVAESLNNLGTVLYKRGNVAQAEPMIRDALAMRTRLFGPDDEKVGKSLNNLAILYYSRGDLARAAPLYRKALAIHREALGHEHPETAALLNNFAILLSQQGNYAQAEDLLIEVLETRRRLLGADNPEIAKSIGVLAVIQTKKEDYDAAEALFREALALRRKCLGSTHLGIATNLINLAATLREKEDYAVADSLYRDGLAMVRRILGDDHPMLVPALRLHAVVLMDMGKHGEAEALCREALSICRVRFGDRHPQVGETLRLLGECLLARGDAAGAEAVLSGAAEIFETARLRAGGGFTRATFRESPYCHLSVARLGMEQKDRAWVAAEKAQARALVDLLFASGQRAEGRTFSLEQVQGSLGEKTALVGWLWVEIPGCEPDAWGYVIRDSGPVGWVHLAPSVGAGEIPWDETASDFRGSLGVAGSWPFRVTETARITSDAGKLWSEWITPLECYLDGSENLVVIPSGPLLGIPVESLVDSHGVYLGDRYTVSYTPSATIFAWLREQGAARPLGSDRNALLVGNPQFARAHLATVAGKPPADLQRLPWTGEEVRRVAASVSKSTVLLGEDASEQQLVLLATSGDLTDFDIIHLATHALVDDERPECSALVLSCANLPDPVEATVSGTRMYDGLLTVKEIVAEFPLNADLVTLSGCQTALGREAGGEGYIGMAYAFLQAGARSLLVSLWLVEDEATALLMGRFYENLTGSYAGRRAGRIEEPLPKAEALREAKHWLRNYTDEDGDRPFRHPAYWSGFVLIGDAG